MVLSPKRKWKTFSLATLLTSSLISSSLVMRFASCSYTATRPSKTRVHYKHTNKDPSYFLISNECHDTRCSSPYLNRVSKVSMPSARGRHEIREPGPSVRTGYSRPTSSKSGSRLHHSTRHHGEGDDKPLMGGYNSGVSAAEKNLQKSIDRMSQDDLEGQGGGHLFLAGVDMPCFHFKARLRVVEYSCHRI